MAISLKRMVNGSQLTTSAVAYYTASGAKAQILAMTLTNTTGGAVTATVHLVPSGGSASASNCILSAKSLAAGASYKVAEAIGQALEDGGSVQALASSGASISLVASGIEYS